MFEREAAKIGRASRRRFRGWVLKVSVHGDAFLHLFCDDVPHVDVLDVGAATRHRLDVARNGGLLNGRVQHVHAPDAAGHLGTDRDAAGRALDHVVHEDEVLGRAPHARPARPART